MSEMTSKDAAPPAAPIPDDLRITAWIDTADPDLELEHDVETVADVRQAHRDVYLADGYYGDEPALFAAADGRVYAAEIGVVVRPATPDEVREGVEAEKESVLGAAAARLVALDGYLKASGA